LYEIKSEYNTHCLSDANVGSGLGTVCRWSACLRSAGNICQSNDGSSTLTGGLARTTDSDSAEETAEVGVVSRTACCDDRRTNGKRLTGGLVRTTDSDSAEETVEVGAVSRTACCDDDRTNGKRLSKEANSEAGVTAGIEGRIKNSYNGECTGEAAAWSGTDEREPN